MAGSGFHRKPRVVLAACGCIATVKFGLLCHCFLEWAEIRGVVTKSALRFVDRATIPSGVFVYYDEYEWYAWKKMDVELLQWADVLVIAPLSANTLAKIVGGYCDDLLSCTVRAWNFSSKPIYVAPSMHPCMWTNPFTEEHIKCIKELGISVIRPVAHKSSNGELRTVTMTEPSDISRIVKITYSNSQTLNVQGVQYNNSLANCASTFR